MRIAAQNPDDAFGDGEQFFVLKMCADELQSEWHAFLAAIDRQVDRGQMQRGGKAVKHWIAG